MSGVTLLLCLLIALATFLAWEGIAWFSHKYIMHGFLWCWHESHHRASHRPFERNDLFALIFSLPSIVLFYLGVHARFNPFLTAAAVGVLGYGIFYFIFHDVIVHQRVKLRIRIKSRYLRRMINAHYAHHEKHTRDGCEAFGFLYAPKKYEYRKPHQHH